MSLNETFLFSMVALEGGEQAHADIKIALEKTYKWAASKAIQFHHKKMKC